MTRTEIVTDTLKRISKDTLLYAIQKDIEDVVQPMFPDVTLRGDLRFTDFLVLAGKGQDDSVIDTLSHMIAAHFGDPVALPPSTDSVFFIWKDTTIFSMSKLIHTKIILDLAGVKVK